LVDISDNIPQSIVAVFEAINSAAQGEGIPFFVIGAAARDMLFRYAYGLPVRRATRDIDIAIRVADWDENNRLVGTLIATGDFKPTEIRRRSIFKGRETIDIVPFGPIAGKKQSIAWPPTEDAVMGVLGFEEAFRAAIPLTLRREPRLDVPVASLAGLAMMKLISWDESYPRRAKDGQDYYYITENYIDAGNDERLYTDAADLLEVDVFDRVVAGARLLGRDMGRLGEGDVQQRIDEIFVRESDPSGPLKLISDIVGTDITMQEKFDEIMGLLQSVRDGFSEGPKQL
jgi:predicted nucleotidyltransferase